jgi:4a-hydroxytetrahydrobiopterin dehydratase
MEKLAQEAIEQKLADFPEWSLTGSGGALQRTFSFGDFTEAMAFVNRMAELAEQQQHHPDIMIRYSKVTLTLSTHDAGGVTDRDFDFVRAVEHFAPAV